MTYTELRNFVESHEYHITKPLEVKRIGKYLTDGTFYYIRDRYGLTTYKANSIKELEQVISAANQLYTIRVKAANRELSYSDLSNPNG